MHDLGIINSDINGDNIFLDVKEPYITDWVDQPKSYGVAKRSIIYSDDSVYV